MRGISDGISGEVSSVSQCLEMKQVSYYINEF